MSVDDDMFDDAEIDTWIEADREADEAAAQLLRDALAHIRGAPAPAELTGTAERIRAELSRSGGVLAWVKAGAGLHADIPADDAELMIAVAAATMSPLEETGLDPEEESLLLTLERADWLGAVVELAREGRGAPVRPADLVLAIHRCPEVEIGPEVDLDDDALTETAFELVTTAWLGLGIVDDRDRLTAVGDWLLPRALARAWGSDFDPD